MIAPLPQELVDQIVECLLDDAASLRSCALTCYAWKRTAQKHLHRTIRVSEHHRAVTAEVYSSHDLAAFVHHIEIRCKPPHPWHRMFQPTDPQPSRWLKDDSTYRTLGLFPHVQRYKFSYMHFSPAVIQNISAFFSNARTPVTFLEIYEASFDDLEGFATLLASFPYLSCLRIDRCQWPHDPNFSFHSSKLYEQGKATIPGPRLRTLRIMVHSQMRTDITKWCIATNLADNFFEWRWEGHAHRAIFDPTVIQKVPCSTPVRSFLCVWRYTVLNVIGLRRREQTTHSRMASRLRRSAVIIYP